MTRRGNLRFTLVVHPRCLLERWFCLAVWELVEGPLPYLRLSFLEERATVRAVFTTRWGGVSEGPFGTLNLGLHVGDDVDRVRRNRRLVAAATGVPLESWVLAEQVHGAQVAVVGRKESGRGAESLETVIRQADGLVTAEPGIALVALFADCVPVYLVDPVRRAVALVHAGWKGTLGGISARAVVAMVETLGCRPEDLWAVIGPSIGPCCYEVKEQVVDFFRREFSGAEYLLQKSAGKESWYLDLWEANRVALLAAGLPPAQIAVAGLCTCCHPELFFSHRRDRGRTGRLAALVSWRGITPGGAI